MNTLFIIGNGFDLAHGLKTSYNDFILWYLKKEVTAALEELPNLVLAQLDNSQITTSKQMLTVGVLRNNIDRCPEFINVVNNLENIGDFFSDKIKTFISIRIEGFLKRLENQINLQNWADIEFEYFQSLLDVIKYNESEIVTFTKKLNSEFSILSDELKLYIGICQRGKVAPNKLFKRIITSKYAIQNPNGSSLILNFNYTETFNQYIDEQQQVINIHGTTLEDEIIFGYGDETTEQYQQLENLNINPLLVFAKSSRYLNNNNYKQVLSFLEFGNKQGFSSQNNFQVVILGHSCGLSDRVLLKEIFEHPNCKDIIPYFYLNQNNGYNNFPDTILNISRHFLSNSEMRSKVKEFDPVNRMPQWDD